MSDFFAPPPGQPQQPTVPAGAPVGGPMPGMPGYSYHQHAQAYAQVAAAAGPPIPRSAATMVATVSGFGGLLMIVGAIAPWVTVSFGGFGSKSVGGLHQGLDGPYLLGMGLAAVLAAGAAVTSQENRQVKQVCAAALTLLGLVGLIIVIHEWSHVTSAFRALKQFTTDYSSTFGSLFAQLHVTKGWGLMLSGVASAATGLAGAYLFLA